MITQSQKRKAARHILYEMQMFYFAFQKIRIGSVDDLTRNALIESCIIHAYNLYRFLYQGESEKKGGQVRSRRQSDIIAEDYIEKGRRSFFRKNRPSKSVFKNLERKRSKLVAHLTYDRLSMRRGWDTDMLVQLWKSVDVFLQAIPEDVNKKWFGGEVQKARKRIESR